MTDRLVVEGYSQLLRKLKKFAPEANKELRKELKAIATVVAGDAKANAGWSSRIPGAIGTTVTNKGAGVKVSRKKAPHGSIYERGSRGNPGQVRHPVFGNFDVWRSSPTRPFIEPAVERRAPELRARGEQALRDAIRKAGW